MEDQPVYVCQPVEPVRRGRQAKNEQTYDAKHKEPEPKHQPSDEPDTPGDDEPTESPSKGEPEPEIEEPRKPQEAYVAKTLSMTADQFESLLARVVGEARKPIIDEKKLRQQKRTRDHNRQMMADNRKMLAARFYGCNHMQLPGSVLSGCAAIAWATQSDGKRRGVCQHCGTVFSSDRSECASDEIWQAYAMLVRLPTHPSGNVNNVFQSA